MSDEAKAGLASTDGFGLEPERKVFEAHMDGLQYNLQRHPDRPHQYANTAIQGRWVSWQEAAKSARERFRAAALTKLPALDPAWSEDVRAAWHRCFEALRDLEA